MYFELGKVDAGTLDARGRTGLKAHQRHAERAQGVGKPLCAHESVGSALVGAVADEDLAGEVCARADDRGAHFPHFAECGHKRADALFAVDLLDPDLAYLALHQTQVLGGFDRVLHQRAVFCTVCLNAFGMHRRALAEVERAALQGDKVGGTAHFAAQRVDLIHKMPLAGTADRRIAGHVADGIEIYGKKYGVKTESCAGECGFDARMSRADHADVCCMLHVIHS